MKFLHKIFKRFMGSDGRNAEILESRQQEAVEIRDTMSKDIARIKKKVDRINTNTYNKLSEISTELESVTYRIAIASGAKTRGLK